MPKYIKSHSNYILRSQHQKTTEGTVFERDFMTISSPNGFSPDQTPVYGDNNFRFVVRQGINKQRKHARGSWVKNGGSELWTVSNVGLSAQTDENKIVLNPDYNSLKDFAYYGSAVELVRASISDIITWFPAELYFSSVERVIDGTTYYEISNDYMIDVDSSVVNVEEEAYNPLRYFIPNAKSYTIISPSGTRNICPESIYVTPLGDVTCEEEANGAFIKTVVIPLDGGDITIYVYSKSGKKSLFYRDAWLNGYRIRPISEIIDEYYQNLEPLEAILINRLSNPRYKAVFNTPIETDEGIVQTKENYTWPSQYGYNPDLSTSMFDAYVERLMSLAEFHDEYDSDNIWRSMTHEAIKNLDSTKQKIGEEYVDNIDERRVNSILRIYGRMYDELKWYIDGITNIRDISYDKKNNMPDYFLSDELENSGFEVTVTNPSNDNSVMTPSLFEGETYGYNSSEANVEFMRRLKLSARHILSKKGTRSGIEEMLGLFGMEKDTDYTIEEFVDVANGGYYPPVNLVTANTSSTISYPVFEYVKCINERKDNYPVTTNDPLYGIPLKQVVITSEDNTYSYVVPWFEKGKEYDDELYFQMKGGWGKRNTKRVNFSLAPNVDYINSDGNNRIIYDETVSNLKIAGNIDDMSNLGTMVVKKGDICYVTDISDIDEKYAFPDGKTSENFSHYFILVNDGYSSYVGYYEPEALYGWRNVELMEISELSTDAGWKVVYLESIVDDIKGNAPHNGYDEYDDGKEYLDRIGSPFMASSFETAGDIITTAVSAYNFTLVEKRDDKKCWYYSDDPNGDISKIKYVNGEYVIDNRDDDDIEESYYAIDPENSGLTASTESSANSVINVKKIRITFNTNSRININGVMTDYIAEVVMPYVKQMVPSTAILEYNIK